MVQVPQARWQALLSGCVCMTDVGRIRAARVTSLFITVSYLLSGEMPFLTSAQSRVTATWSFRSAWRLPLLLPTTRVWISRASFGETVPSACCRACPMSYVSPVWMSAL